MSLTGTLKGIPGWRFEKRRDPSFNFLPEPHEYHFKGSRLWSPSGVFLDVGYVDLTYYKPEDRHRGQYVHRATHLIDIGDRDIWKTMYSDGVQYLGFVEAYCEFKEAWRFIPRMREVPIYNPDYLFATTPDGEGHVLGGDPAIVELKTGNMPWWTKVQTAAHDLAVSYWDPRETFRRRIGVELKKNGKFRAKEFTDEDDYDLWKANLKTSRGRRSEPPVKLTEALSFQEIIERHHNATI